MIKRFDKSNLNLIRGDINKILESYAKKNGITIKLGNIRFSEGEFSSKIEAKIPGIETMDDTILKSVMASSKLNKNGRDGRVLVSYNTRSRAYPFVYSQNGKMYKCSKESAQFYFS
jgi:hypothetical protein